MAVKRMLKIKLNIKRFVSLCKYTSISYMIKDILKSYNSISYVLNDIEKDYDLTIVVPLLFHLL